MIGVISDTHGLVRPEVLPVFAGAALIIHAGDIGTSEVLKELKSIAPVIAVWKSVHIHPSRPQGNRRESRGCRVSGGR